eukprot:scaffold2385_cov178-Amphora_coffeaeformis.AAC.8
MATFLADTEPWSTPSATIGGKTVTDASFIASNLLDVVAARGFTFLQCDRGVCGRDARRCGQERKENEPHEFHDDYCVGIR